MLMQPKICSTEDSRFPPKLTDAVSPVRAEFEPSQAATGEATLSVVASWRAVGFRFAGAVVQAKLALVGVWSITQKFLHW